MMFNNPTVVGLLMALAVASSSTCCLAFQQVVLSPANTLSRGVQAPHHTLLNVGSRVNTHEGAERDIGTMDQWATACEVQKAEGFQLTTEDGMDWSVMTTQDLPEGSPVLYVPAQMILSSQGAKQELEQLGDISGGLDYLGRLGQFSQLPQFFLFLKVLVEYERGDGSPYFPWLNSLPRLFFNAVSMTDFCHECLPPLVFSLARTECVTFDNFYYALQKVDIISQETKEDKELAKWAFNVVHTRCWGPEDHKQIIPMADMFNHGTDTEVQITNDEQGNCIVYTTHDVPAGSPLRVSYADPTNPSKLFATYGFLDETSPATFCKLMIQPTEELRNLGYDYSRMLFYKDTGDISPEVWDVLLYHTVLANNQDDRLAFYQAHMNGDEETKQAMHQHYFPQTAAALQNHVDTFLKQLETLSGKGRGKNVEEHPRLPLIMNHNDFVKSTFLTVKANLDPMVAQTAGV